MSALLQKLIVVLQCSNEQCAKTLGPTHTFGLAPTRAALGFSGRSRHMNFGTGCVQGGLAHVGLGLGRAGDDSGPLAH